MPSCIRPFALYPYACSPLILPRQVRLTSSISRLEIPQLRGYVATFAYVVCAVERRSGLPEHVN